LEFRSARLHDLSREVWAPTPKDWWQAGRLIRSVGDDCTLDRNKRRDFQNDTLIALTARRHGATVVAANRLDFALLGSKLRVPVLFA
jgi:hypothetical protein